MTYYQIFIFHSYYADMGTFDLVPMQQVSYPIACAFWETINV